MASLSYQWYIFSKTGCLLPLIGFIWQTIVIYLTRATGHNQDHFPDNLHFQRSPQSFLLLSQKWHPANEVMLCKCSLNLTELSFPEIPVRISWSTHVICSYRTCTCSFCSRFCWTQNIYLLRLDSYEKSVHFGRAPAPAHSPPSPLGWKLLLK